MTVSPKRQRQFLRAVFSTPLIGPLLSTLRRRKRILDREERDDFKESEEDRDYTASGDKMEGYTPPGVIPHDNREDLMSYGQNISGCDFFWMLLIVAAICLVYRLCFKLGIIV